MFLKCMEDQCGCFFVFVVGYLDNMEIFLKVNFGLSFCFDKMLCFEDYSLIELLKIVVQMFMEYDLYFIDEVNDYLCSYFQFFYDL